MAKGCFHCLRILVILFNLLFVLIGCAILGVAIFLYVDKTFKGIKENIEEGKRFYVDILLFTAIGIGGITIIVSTFGCCGAYHESECLLGTYFFCLFVIVAAEIAAGVVCFLKFDEAGVKDILNKSIKSSIDSYMKESGTNVQPPQHLKRMQQFIGCCGATGWKDYLASAMPDSIASIGDALSNPGTRTERIISACDAKYESASGCTDKIYTIVNNNKLYVLIGFLAVALVELISMIVAMSLCCTVRRMESGYIGVST